MKIIVVVGARPNFMKAAPIIRELDKHKDIEYVIVHTGQHYDSNMSDIFFKELNIPKPKISLNVGSGSHASQTAKIMERFEVVLEEEKPNIVIVFGDINSTIACSLVVSKMEDIALAHIEAGCRSFDRKMPEEINRVVTDHLSDYLFCPTFDDKANLLKEGISEDKIHLVGNVMLDNLFYNLKKPCDLTIPDKYALLTIHRASNTDNKENLESILETVNIITKDISVIFPIHPRTEKQIKFFKLEHLLEKLDVIEPLGFIQFSHYLKNAKFVLTDSGGVQVESSALGVSCITLRDNTEWKYTIEIGSNNLTGINRDKILQVASRVEKCSSIYGPENVSKSIVSILKWRN